MNIERWCAALFSPSYLSHICFFYQLIINISPGISVSCLSQVRSNTLRFPTFIGIIIYRENLAYKRSIVTSHATSIRTKILSFFTRLIRCPIFGVTRESPRQLGFLATRSIILSYQCSGIIQRLFRGSFKRAIFTEYKNITLAKSYAWIISLGNFLEWNFYLKNSVITESFKLE